MRLKRVTIPLGFVAAFALWYWSTHRSPSVDPVPADTSVSTLDSAALHRSYERGNLSSTAATIQASGTTDHDLLVLAANCYRHLGNSVRFQSAIKTATEAGVDPEILQLALDLLKVQAGDFDGPLERVTEGLQKRGASDNEARRAVISGSLMRSDIESSTRLIDQWHEQEPDSVDLRHLRSMLATSQSRWDEAEASLLDAVTENQQHELSYLSLADMYSKPPQVNLGKCRVVLEQCRDRFPENNAFAIQLAQVNRKLGNSTVSGEILDTLKSPETNWVVLLERTDLAFDVGDYEQSIQWMSQGELSSADRFVSIIDMAFRSNLDRSSNSAGELSQRVKIGAATLSLGGRRQEAATVFDFLFDRSARQLRFRDLQMKSQFDRNDQAIADEIKLVVAPASDPGCPTLSGITLGKADQLAPGDQLYLDHCAKCHGQIGDGFGLSARQLFPAPRSFRDEPIRIVSNSNSTASDKDIAKAIREGLGGASMPAFPQLSVKQVNDIVAVVRRFQVDGLRHQYDRKMMELGVESDEMEKDESGKTAADQWVEQKSSLGEPLVIPEFDPTSDDSAARGQAAFARVGCKQCHEDSTEDGEGLPRLFDTLGRPVASRSLDTDRFRGGNSREEIYKRVVLGIPGTPHPSISGIPEEQIVDIVNYVHELSKTSHQDKRPQSPTTTNSQRRNRHMLRTERLN